MASLILNGERLDIRPDESILSAAQRAGHAAEQIPASCQGAGRCRECIVEITHGHDALTPLTESEVFLQSRSDSEGKVFRLACQARIARDDTGVEVETFKQQLEITVAGRPMRDPVEPWIERRGEAIYCDDQRIAEHTSHLHGLAIDVGTTTVVLHAVDLESGDTQEMRAFENPQRYGGSDVMHRISYDRDQPGRLHRTIIAHLNHALETLPFDPRTIFAITIAGNPTMRDLLFGLDVQSLGQSPFVSSTQAQLLTGRRRSTTLWSDAASLGLNVHPQARILGLPLISHHVGADTAAILATLDLAALTDPFLMIDIGTNTEVVAGRGDRLIAASCAAGPAFEGGRVACGMTACQGAITEIRRRNGSWQFTSVGSGPARGICGSGLVDILAELRASGEMDEMGRFRDGVDRISIAEDPPLFFTRVDASELAQTKAAVALGQEVLLRKLGIAASQIGTCYLAGAFANQLNLDAARRIGLLLPVSADRVVRLGNASIEGAKAVLLSRRCRDRIESLVRTVEHVQLEKEPDFFDLYAGLTRLRPIDAKG